MAKYWIGLVVTWIGMSAFLFGCGGNAPNEAAVKEVEPKISADPVTLTMYLGVAIGDEEAQKQIVEPVRKRYPNITLQLLGSKDGKLEEMIAGNQTPDFFLAGTYMQSLFDVNYQLPLDPLIKKLNVDLSVLDQGVVDSVRTISGGSQMLAMPFSKNMMGLWYNKSLFDKFGVSYPKDGMTWDDAYELAKKLTRADNGVQYRGIEPLMNNDVRYSGMVFSLPFVDPKTEKAVIGNKWADIFKTIMVAYDIPGNKPQAKTDPLTAFVKDQTLAMYPTFLNKMLQQLEKATNLNWDVAQLPSFKELPNTTIQADYNQFAVSRTTKHPEQAMQVLSVLISDESQMAVSRMGRLPVNMKPEIIKAYAQENAQFKGKNIEGIFKSKFAKTAPTTNYDSIVQKALNAAISQVVGGTEDINTALRKAEESANSAIATAKSK